MIEIMPVIMVSNVNNSNKSRSDVSILTLLALQVTGSQPRTADEDLDNLFRRGLGLRILFQLIYWLPPLPPIP